MQRTTHILLLLLLLPLAALSQTAEIKKMRQQVSSLQQQIAKKENILLSSKKDIESKLSNLNLLTAKIDERKELIALLTTEVAVLNKEIKSLNAEVADKEELVAVSKKEYASALNRSRRYGTFQDKLLFVISADNFNSMLRRYRYAREYMQAYKLKGEELKEAIAALNAKKAVLDSTLLTKKVSLEEQEHQRKALQLLEEQQRTLVKELKKESRKVERELAAQRKKLNKLNSEIERAIEREIKAQQAREQAARKKAAAAAKTAKKGSKTPAQAPVTAEAEEIKQMSGTFAQNKGKLPVPITGAYHVVATFGPQKGVASKGTVKIDYGGIMLEGERGAKTRCIFDGRVVSVIRQGDFAFVLVRHGKYISVYCRLDDIVVKEGDKIKAGDIIGSIAHMSGHTRLQFQLRNERTKLNPMQWLKLK